MKKMVEKFLDNKKTMEAKMDAARKMADDAAEEFMESIKSLVGECSEEELKEFIHSDDKNIDEMDKFAVAGMFAEAHDCGLMVLGIRH